jgi:hypothetical protein
MLPRWHIAFGAVFTFIIWVIFPNTNPSYLALVFLSSFLIDLDHYLQAFFHTKHLSLFEAFEYYKILEKRELENYKKGIRKKGDFHVFHTIEFHLLIAILGTYFTIFSYIFLGMFFHSILDFADMAKRNRLYTREYFFFNWLRKKYFS